MSKVLLKRAGNKSEKKYQEDVAKLLKVTIDVKANTTSEIKMISVKELHTERKKVLQNKSSTSLEP